MIDIDFNRELLSRVRAIASNSIDPWASERLRAMAAEIERHLMQELARPQPTRTPLDPPRIIYRWLLARARRLARRVCSFGRRSFHIWLQ